MSFKFMVILHGAKAKAVGPRKLGSRAGSGCDNSGRATHILIPPTLNEDPAFFRICISDRKLDRLVSLKGVRRFWTELGGQWTELAPK
jgi:hypothetical protein